MTKMTRDEMFVDHANLFTTARWLLAEARWWAEDYRDKCAGYDADDAAWLPWEVGQ